MTRICNVLNCGNGSCVHELTSELCPECGMRLVRVKTTGYMFCSNSELICDYERGYPRLVVIDGGKALS